MYWVGAWVLWGKWTILRGTALQCILLSEFFDRLSFSICLYYSLSPIIYIALLSRCSGVRPAVGYSSNSISSGSGTYLFTYLMTGAVESVQQWDVVLHCSSSGSSSSSSSRSGTYLFTYLLTGALESVQQRLWDNFSKQSKEEQGLYYCQLMALSAALARGSVNGHARAADYHCQLILHAISHHFYSVLRPKILATTEMVRPQSNCAFSLLDCITCTRHTVPRSGLMLPIFHGFAGFCLLRHICIWSS